MNYMHEGLRLVTYAIATRPCRSKALEDPITVVLTADLQSPIVQFFVRIDLAASLACSGLKSFVFSDDTYVVHLVLEYFVLMVVKCF